MIIQAGFNFNRRVQSGKGEEMNQDMDVRSYFVENVPKSVYGKEAWEWVIETLLQNGVKTMQEFGEKDDGWFSRVFPSLDRRSNERRYNLAQKVRDDYFAAVRKSELLAAGEDLIETYIREYTPTELKSIAHRAVLAMRRAGIETMSALCARSEEELKGIRNMGTKSVALALLVRERYTAEKKGNGMQSFCAKAPIPGNVHNETIDGGKTMTTTINILTTNDIHGRFLSEVGSDILEYAKLCTYKKSLSNCLLVDAGDATQGTPLAILERGLYPIKIMNAIGYDAVTIGNHEFDNISKDEDRTCELDDIIASSNAPYICANVIWKSSNENYIQRVYQEKKITSRGNGRYLYKEIDGKKLLFVGVCTPEISMTIPRMIDFEINKVEVVVNIKNAIADAKTEYHCERFDAVVLLAHIGSSTSGYNTKNLIDRLSLEDNISLIIDGHSHEKYSEDYKGVKIFQADCYSKFFGHITLEFDNNNKLTITTEHCTNEKIKQCREDDGVNNEFSEIKKRIEKKFGTVYSSGSNMTLWGGALDEDKPYVRDVLEALNITRFVQTNFGRLTAESMIHTVRTNHSDKVNETDYIVAGINGGAVRDSIPFGKIITGNELYYALPSLLDSEKESGYVLFNISIKRLKEVLDNSIKGLKYDSGLITAGSGGFLNTGGIRYTIKYNSENQNKMELDDKAVLTCGKNQDSTLKEISFSADGNKTVLMCVSKYIASGGDGYNFRDVQELCRVKDPLIYRSAGEYIQYLSGSAGNTGKTLFYPAVSDDVQYKDFSFAKPSPLTVKLLDQNDKLLTNQYVVYCFCDDNYKNYNVAITSKTGELTITPPEGASVLCIGATIGVAEKNETYLRGEVYLHSYFSLKKSKIECRVYPINTSSYISFDKNAWSQFEHKAINGGEIHYSNYIKYFNENGEGCTLTIVEGKILTWLDKDKNIKQVTTVMYLDENRKKQQFSAPFPQEGISYLTWSNTAYATKLVNEKDVSPLEG